MSDETNPYAAIEATAAKPDADKGANPYADIEAKAKPAPIVGTTDAGGQIADDPEAAAARGVPGMTPDRPVYDAAQAAPAKAIARASLAPDPEVEKQRYSQFYKQPIEDFSVHGDKVIRKTADNRYVYAEPPDWKSRLESPQKYVASGVGQAIPMATGAAAGALAAGATAETGPGAFVAATAAHAAGGAGGEIIRQSMDRALAPDATPMDWANVGWQALQQGLGPLGGKAADVAGKGLVGAGKWTTRTASAAAGKIGDMIQNVPGLQGLVAQGKPIVQNVTQAVDDAGQNLLGLTQEARDAVMHHLAGKFDDIKAGIQNARDNWGIDLSIGQATENQSIMRRERQLSRTPWGAEAFSQRHELQNEQQIPGAMNKFMDEVHPDSPANADDAVAKFRTGADTVVSKMQKAQADKAKIAYGAALDDPSKPLPFTDDLRELFQRPMMKEAWERAQTSAANRGQELPKFVNFNAAGDPVFSDTVQPTWRSVDQIKRALDQIRSDNVNSMGKPTGKGADADNLRRSLLDIVDPQNPAYKAARSQYGESADVLDQMLGGGVGMIQKMSGVDRQNMVSRVFGGTENTPGPGEIGRMRQYFDKAGAIQDWNAGLRAHLQNALNKAITTTQTADASNVGGKLYKGLWSNKPQEDVIKAALGNDGAMIDRWNSLGDALRRAAHQLGEGSPTITDAPITGIKAAIKHGIGAAKAVLSPGHAAMSALEDFATKGETPEARRQIVNYMLTTDGDAQLRALQSTMKSVPAAKPGKQMLLPAPAQNALGAFLAAAAAHTDTVQETPQEPTYRHGGTIDRAHTALRNLPRLAS